MDEILWCYHLNETSSAVLSHGTIFLVCSYIFWVCGWNYVVFIQIKSLWHIFCVVIFTSSDSSKRLFYNFEFCFLFYFFFSHYRSERSNNKGYLGYTWLLIDPFNFRSILSLLILNQELLIGSYSMYTFNILSLTFKNQTNVYESHSKAKCSLSFQCWSFDMSRTFSTYE